MGPRTIRNNCWKYRPKLPPVYITITDFDHFICIFRSCLRMVRYPHYLRDFSSQFLIINIRDQHIVIFRIRATDIMNIDIFAAILSFLLALRMK